MPRRMLPVLADRSGSDSDECMFDQSQTLPRRGRTTSIARLRKSNSTMSGQRLTIARTVNLCLSFFALGLCFMMPTATIAGLQYRTSSSGDDIEFIYTSRYGGYIVGAFVGGFLFNCYNRQFLLFLSLLATAIGILVTPFCGILATLMTCSAITGSTMGLLDTGGNVWLLDLWGRKSAPYMQMMHFCFGLGALVAPLVAQPFIGAYNELDIHQSAGGNVHSIFSPMGAHLTNKPFHRHFVRRDMDHLASMTLAPPTVSDHNSTELPRTTPVPKKPLFADSKKLPDKWERKLPTDITNTLLAAKKAAANATAKPTTPTVLTTEHPEAARENPKGETETGNSTRSVIGKTASAVTSAASSANATAKTATTKAPPPTDKTLLISSKKSIAHPDAPILSIHHLDNHEAPARSNATDAKGIPSDNQTASIDSSTSNKTTMTHPKVDKGAEHLSENKTAIVEIKTTAKPSTDSTTKLTSSTVPTEDSAPVITGQKHHSIKKVLSEVDQEDSWIEQTRKRVQKSGRFEIAYGILAGYVLMVAIVFLLFLCMNPREAKSKQEEELNDLHQSSRMRLPLTMLMCSFFFLYMGLEVSVAETLKSLFRERQSQSLTGEQLVYSFWGSFAIARGLSIFISMRYTCKTMLIANMALCLAASVILVCGAEFPYVLMTGVVVLGTGMASIIPTSFIWLERYTQVTNKLSAQLVLSSAAGEMVLPELILAFTSKSPIVLVYVILVVIVLCSINLAALCYVTSIRGEKYLTKPDRSLYQLASLDDDIETWNAAARKNQFDDVQIKRNKSNTFFYDRLNNDS